MAKTKKSPVKRRSTSATKTRSQSVGRMRRNVTAHRIGRFAVPLLVSLLLLAGIGFFGAMGYSTATASNFFTVRTIQIYGVDRSADEDIRRIVAVNTEKTGVWRADLPLIRERIEKLPFIRSASVSMTLPAGIRVNITERVPQSIVRLGGGDFLVDGEGVIIAPVTKAEASLPFVMRGWDEAKSEKAATDNLARLKLYGKMMEEWKSIGIADRVKEVNLKDIRDPEATIEDAGHKLPVSLARDNLGKSLKSAIEAVAGKGEKIRSVNSGGIYPILEYIGN